MQRKITFSSELAYLLAVLIMSFSVAMVAASDFGVSMIVGPAYILSLAVEGLTFGQSEYVVQGILFILFCLLIRSIKPIYFVSFFTALFYGAALDLWRLLIPAFNPAVVTPGSQAMPLRIFYFACGTLITAFSVALCFKTYIYPQVYDYFVKGVAGHFKKDRTKFKIFFDALFFTLSLVMTLILFSGCIEGIGIGTIITTLVNGLLIGGAEKLLDRFCTFKATFPQLEKMFTW